LHCLEGLILLNSLLIPAEQGKCLWESGSQLTGSTATKSLKNK